MSVAVILDYKIYNKKAYELIDTIFTKVLSTEYTLYHLAPVYFGEDDFYVIKDKEYESQISPQIIEEDLLITLGSRCSKFYTGEPRLLKSIGQVYNLNDKKVYTNYSPTYILNNKDLLKTYIETINNAIEKIDITSFYTKFKIISSIDELNKVVDMCIAEKTFCFDFETTGLLFFKDKPTIMSISFNVGFSYILPLYHTESVFKDNIDEVVQILSKRIFENADVVKYGHNIKFDLHFIRMFFKCKLKGRYNDSMLMHHLLDENTDHKLKSLTKRYFAELANYEQSIKGLNWSTIPLDKLSQYAAIDTDVTLRLCIIFEAELMEDDMLYDLYRNLTCVANIELLKAEHHGAYIDRKYIEDSIEYANSVLDELYDSIYENSVLKKYTVAKSYEFKFSKISELEAKLKNDDDPKSIKYNEGIRAKINEIALTGVNFKINLRSPKQLSDFMYSKEGLNLPLVYDKNKKQHTKTTSKTKLREANNDFLNILFEIRTVEKLISTYYKGILNRLDDNNYLHSSFLLHGTVTGRLSSSNPNLQNIPVFYKSNNEKVKDLFSRVKKFFIVPEDTIMMCCDFSQAELRCIANFSQDSIMIDAYLSGKDLHSVTAASIAKVNLDEYENYQPSIKDPLRRAAKDANFGYVYGCSPETYQRTIFESYGRSLDIQTCQLHRDALFKTYLGLNKWHSNSIKIGKKYGYVRTLFGRKRRLININGSNNKLVSADTRYAINSPIQGTSGEWTIFSICILMKIFPDCIIFFNNVHDAMYFYVPKSLVKIATKYIANISEYPLIDTYFKIDKNKTKVPMKLDIEYTSTNWYNKSTKYE